MCVMCGRGGVDARFAPPARFTRYVCADVGAAAPSGDVGLMGAVAAPAGNDGDGRALEADVPGQQPAWGWGLASAQAHGDVARALTELPANPNGYTQRQQDAVRRDIAGRVGSYLDYAPVPFAGGE